MITPRDLWARLLRQPFTPLLPLMALVLGLAALLAAIHLIVVVPAQLSLAGLEAEWMAARKRFVRHVEAKQARQDLAEVLRMIPTRHEFAPLALRLTDQATRNQVSMPSLSYHMEQPKGELATKAVFQGAATGRYEDLRRFIRELERADALVFIEDLDVVRSGARHDSTVTFNLSIATYLRARSG